jgi:hypothetical protein
VLLPVLAIALLASAQTPAPFERSPSTFCNQLAAPASPHADELAATCWFAQQLQQRMPNFICEETVSRYISLPVNSTMAPSDVIKAAVTYEHGDQRLQDITVNGQPAAPDFAQLSGMWSIGEFGNYLLVVFVETSKAQFRFAKEDTVRNRPALAFDFNVSAANNRSYQVVVNGASYYPSFEGRLWIDAESVHPLRLDFRTPDLATTAGLTRSEMTIYYADVPLGDGTTFVLPVESETNACRRRNQCTADNTTNQIELVASRPRTGGVSKTF